MGKRKYGAKFFVWNAGNSFDVCYIPSLASNEATKKTLLKGTRVKFPDAVGIVQSDLFSS